MALTDDDLREAASHRGLKLIKSRRRKPGVGDFGLFGLADASGQSLFGIGEHGLTATSEQIADFLRKGEASTWAASADSTPQRPIRERPGTVIHEDAADAAPTIRRRSSSRASTREKIGRRAANSPTAKHAEPTDAKRQKAESSRIRNPAPEPKTVRKVKPELQLELAIRAARPADADSLRELLGPLGSSGSAAEMRRAITAATKRKEPIFIAERGGIIGCLAWHVVPTIQEGALARITMIAVNRQNCRRGIGRALYEAALSEFRKRKVQTVEAMSDIEIRNANGFYRALGFMQASYRFTYQI